MWMRRIVGLALAAGGAALFALLLYPSFSHDLRTGPPLIAGMAPALLIGMAALIAFVLGAHLLLPGGFQSLRRRRP